MIYNSKASNHLLYYCKDPNSIEYRRRYQRYQSLFRSLRPFESLSTCFFCFLPPTLCQKWASNRDKPGWTKTNNDCSYPDITLSIFVIALSLPSFKESYTRRLGLKSIDNTEISEAEIRYLGETIQWAGTEVSRLFEVIVEAIQTIKDEQIHSIR